MAMPDVAAAEQRHRHVRRASASQQLEPHAFGVGGLQQLVAQPDHAAAALAQRRAQREATSARHRPPAAARTHRPRHRTPACRRRWCRPAASPNTAIHAPASRGPEPCTRLTTMRTAGPSREPPQQFVAVAGQPHFKSAALRMCSPAWRWRRTTMQCPCQRPGTAQAQLPR